MIAAPIRAAGAQARHGRRTKRLPGFITVSSGLGDRAGRRRRRIDAATVFTVSPERLWGGLSYEAGPHSSNFAMNWRVCDAASEIPAFV
jgi:hypothetical protein